MKTKTWRNASQTCRTYCKSIGNGWEVGFIYGKKLLFVGNFIHSSEATRWFTVMNREIRTFSRRFTVGKTYPKTWFANFLANFLYKKYYAYLDALFAKYNRNYNRAYSTGTRKYRRMTSHWPRTQRTTFLKAA